MSLLVFTSSRCTSVSGREDLQFAAGPAPLGVCAASAQDSELIKEAERDPAALLERGLKWHDANLRDYEGTFWMQERREGRLTDRSACRFRFRAKPFSVLLRWVRGAGRIDKLLYVQGRNDGNMIVHPTGLTGRLLTAIALDPHGERAQKGGSRPITEFGMRKALERILESFRKDMREGTLRSQCLGLGVLEGVKVLTLQRSSPGKSLTVDLDVRTLLPLRIRRYGENEKLLAFYQYGDLRFNCGLNDAAFSREANGLSK